jgi:F0F1-type ATP synthase membrane subunit c/vacuolar-type H+-ATPase subunit K
MPTSDPFLVRVRRRAAWSLLIPGLACALVGLGFAISNAEFISNSVETSAQIARLVPMVFTFRAANRRLYTITSKTASTNPPRFDVGESVRAPSVQP